MKRITVSILTCFFLLPLLTSCAAKNTAASPVWQSALPNTGTEVRVYDCALQEGSISYWADLEGEPVSLPALYAGDSAPVLELDASKEEINIQFAQPADGGLAAYQQPYAPVEDVDIVFETAPEDSTTRCRFDTIYNYYITVTADGKSDSFVLLCSRSGYGIQAP